MAQGQEVRFFSIYREAAWKSGGVLSGHGSRIDTTDSLRDWIEAAIDDGRVKTILDLGCGDLTWVSSIEGIVSMKAQYYGVDIVPSLIAHHRRIFPWFKGEASDLEAFVKVDSDLVILKDVLPHHCTGTAGQILKLIDFGRWKYLITTSHPKAVNKLRSGVKGSMWVPYNVEKAAIIRGVVTERLVRPEDGEYQIWTRSEMSP